MVLGVSNKPNYISIIVICMACMAFSLVPQHTPFDRLLGRWNVTEESNEFKIQTYRVRIKQDPGIKILKDGSRCASYTITNFGGFGRTYELKTYFNRGVMQIDSSQVLNNRITVVSAKGSVSEKHSSMSWQYTIRVKSKDYQFKATFVEDK